MPTLISNIKSSGAKKSFGLFWGATDSHTTGNIAVSFIGAPDTSFFHSNLLISGSRSYNTVIDIAGHFINKKFVRLESLFMREFEKISHHFKGISYDIAHQKMSESLSILMGFNPDQIKLELTPEGAVFYTFKKGLLSIYVMHYIVEDLDFDEDDELTMTVFEGDEKLPSYAGSLSGLKEELILLFSDNSSINMKLLLDEIPS